MDIVWASVIYSFCIVLASFIHFLYNWGLINFASELLESIIDQHYDKIVKETSDYIGNKVIKELDIEEVANAIVKDVSNIYGREIVDFIKENYAMEVSYGNRKTEEVKEAGDANN